MYDTESKVILSIVVPIYNRVKYLEECVSSILYQKHKLPGPIQLIFIDDASTKFDIQKHVEGLLAQLHQKKDLIINDFMVSIRKQKENVGEYRNVNGALRNSIGLWKFILHDDDYVLDNFFQTIFKYIQCNKNTNIVGYLTFGYKNIDDKGVTLYEKCDITPEGIWKKEFSDIVFLKGNPMHVHCMLFYHTVFDELGYFDEELKYYNDLEFFIRSRKTELKWLYMPKTCVVYRIHNDNTQSMERKANGDKYKKLLDNKIAKYLKPDKYMKLIQHINAKQFKEAQVEAKKMLITSREETKIWKYLSIIYLSIGDTNNSLIVSNKALELSNKQNPNHVNKPLLNYEYNFLIAEAYKMQGKRSEAIALYNKLIAIKDNPEVYKSLSILEETDRISNIEKYLKLKPNDPLMLLRLALEDNPWNNLGKIRVHAIKALQILTRQEDKKKLLAVKYPNIDHLKYLDDIEKDQSLWYNDEYKIFIIKLSVAYGLYHLGPQMLLPLKVMYDDKQDIIKDRLGFSHNLDLLIKHTPKNCVSLHNLIPTFKHSSFGYYLAYHNTVVLFFWYKNQ